MAAVPSPQQLLQELSELPPTVNPYLFLQTQVASVFGPATKFRTATEACAIAIAVFFFISALCSVIQLVQCFRHPQPLVTKMSTKFGPLVRLNEDLVWPVLMLLCCVAFELQAACLLQNLFHVPKIWEIALRSSCFIVAEVTGLFRATHSVSRYPLWCQAADQLPVTWCTGRLCETVWPNELGWQLDRADSVTLLPCADDWPSCSCCKLANS